MQKGAEKHEVEMGVAASKAWDVYGTLKLAKLVEEKLPSVVSSATVLDGDGGVGTLVQVKLNPASGSPVPGFTEKFTVIDAENRVKETEVVEGGFLDLGFTLYRVRFQIDDKCPGESCLVTSSVYYEVPWENSSAVNLVSIDSLAAIATIANDYLTTS